MTDFTTAKLSADISSLQQDMAKSIVLVDRLDVTIEKLTEVSTSVSRLLAVHENRLEHQEKIGTQLSNLIEKRKEETDEAIKLLHARISSGEKELYNEFDDQTNKIVKKLDEIQEQHKIQHDELNKRINTIEKWVWMVSGGSIGLGFILSYVFEILKLF